MYYFEFAGISSADMGIVIETPPAYNSPKRLGEAVAVPGRNGTLHISTGAFENVTVQYEAWFSGTAMQAHAIKAWLLAAPGYQRLADSEDADYFRSAAYAGPAEIENILFRAGKLTIAFDCKPQCFLTDGEATITYTKSGTLYNPTQFPARPWIRVYSAGILTVNGYVCRINAVNGYVDLDSDTMQASKDGISCNSDVLVTDYPQISNGWNSLILDGISKIDLIPRWWTV